MVRRIHHVNFIVRDLEASIRSYERVLGMPVTSRERLERRGVDIARFRLCDSWLVLVQPTRSGTVPAKYLETHGEGFFLLSLEVDSIEQQIERLGSGQFDGGIRDGLDDWRLIDLDSRTTAGVQLQFVEPGNDS